MKNIIFSSLVILFIGQAAFAQTERTLSTDEQARVKFSLHLMHYSNPLVFENATGEAYYNVVNASFLENCTIPTLQNVMLTANDQITINTHLELLRGSIQNPLTWEHLLALEAQYLNWMDQSQHKVSIYKK
jgi:hypothetical protein